MHTVCNDSLSTQGLHNVYRDMHTGSENLKPSKTKTKSLGTQLMHRWLSGKIYFCTFVYLNWAKLCFKYLMWQKCIHLMVIFYKKPTKRPFWNKFSRNLFSSFSFDHNKQCCNICSCNFAGWLSGCLDFMVFAKCLG